MSNLIFCLSCFFQENCETCDFLSLLIFLLYCHPSFAGNMADVSKPYFIRFSQEYSPTHFGKILRVGGER